MSVDLETLCEFMYEEGFDCAAFARPDMFDFTNEQGVGLKPRGTVYFSELQAEADADTGEIRILPAWYIWLIKEEYSTQFYSQRDLAFATFHKSMIVPQSLIARNTEYSKDRAIDWNQVHSDGWSGIHVTKPKMNKRWKEARWHVPTVAIWNPSAFAELLIFKNIGPWRYTQEPENISL